MGASLDLDRPPLLFLPLSSQLSSRKPTNGFLLYRPTFYPCLQGRVAKDPFFCKLCTLDFEPALIYVLRKTLVPLCLRPADVSPNRGYNFLPNQKLQTFFYLFLSQGYEKSFVPTLFADM